ncbi:MAG: S8 family serine peptidase [Candidatus Margulisbacteria bacterium]|nr:S8 family serine peptidase [Candidatus Margulisiibacteriota bacterium]MBU1616723.1 S8 family serine peptidase [Candidatus Margulisiibacteriota bacterium]
MRRTAIAIFLLLFLAASVMAEITPGQVVVKFKPGAFSSKSPVGVISSAMIGAASIRALNEKHGIYRYKQIYSEALKIRPDWAHLENDYILFFPTSESQSAIINEFEKDQNVVAAQANGVVRAFQIIPNDTYFAQEWGLTKIMAPNAWDRTTGASTNIVAVMDTGLNYSHEDIAGKVDLAHAKDLYNGDNDPRDDNGHGTAISGVIGAISNNSKGVAGVDWQVTILPIKVLNRDGVGDPATISAGLAYLAALKSSGVNIVAVNLSLGQYNEGPDMYVEENPANMRDRCLDAYNQGIVVVAAAGNGSVDWNTYPAYYPTVLAVSATGTDDKRSVWSGLDEQTFRTQASNYGSWVDIAAPGTNIFSMNMDGTYSAGWNGTSLAAPFVAGAVSLLKAAEPTLTNAQIMDRLKKTADPIDALQEPAYKGLLGSGRLNLSQATIGLLTEITVPVSGSYIKGLVQISGTASGWNFGGYTIEAYRASSLEVIVAHSALEVDNGTLANWDTAGINGALTLKLKAVATTGGSSETSVNVIVDNTPPDAAIIYPTSGGSIEGAITITGRATDENLDNYVIEYGQGAAPAYYQALGTFYTSARNVLATWETTGLSGPYILRLTVTDLAGNISRTELTVNISKVSSSLAPGVVTFALPNPFDRNNGSSTTFYYQLQANANTSVNLFELGGNMIWQKSYLAGENGAKAGVNNPAWDGKNLFGANVPTGVYLYQIISDRKVVGRGKVIILN